MDMGQYLEIFIEESKEHLQRMNECLLQLEKETNDIGTINELFRVAHTLKGMSGTMGYSKMATLTHDLEDVLDGFRSAKLFITPETLDLLFKCLDALENYVENIVNTGNEGDDDYKELIDALSLVAEGKPITEAKQNTVIKPETNTTVVPQIEDAGQLIIKYNEYDKNVIQKANEQGMNVFKIDIILDKGCLLKAARAFIIFQILERYSEIIKASPSVEDIEDEKFDFSFTVVVITEQAKKVLEQELNSVAEVNEVVIKPVIAEQISISDSHESTGQNPTQADVKVNEIKVETSNATTPKNIDASTAKSKKTGKTVRVDIDRLDILMNLVSELIIIKNGFEDLDGMSKANTYNESLEYLERVTTNLHDAVMKVRMVPVETVFNRFPRLIRDLSKDLNKDIELVMSGEETELDRTVIDEIGDPLIHILRNSADHGLESQKARIEAGKSQTGHIYLRAYQDGNNVVIEVEDDGQGINVEKVRNKIVERGLLSEDIAQNLADRDIIDYLFKPSFSTADKITDVSGRGVGLDVVKTKIETLGGVVEVDTEMGKGSKFIIRLPLTLAIIQALLVLIGKEKYAIPLNSIKEIININEEDIKQVQKQEVMLLRNMVIPIVRLDKILDVPNRDETNGKKQLTVVIVKKGDKLSGFVVDSLIGQQETVIKSLGKILSGIKCIAGATILGDGNVALIIDVNSLA